MDESFPYSVLVEGLRLVAAPAPMQIDVLPEFVVVTDEILSAFDDAFVLLPQLEAAGTVPTPAGEVIRQLDAWFDTLPGDGSLANPHTLASHPFWSRARDLASEALRLLGESFRRPSFDRVRWEAVEPTKDGEVL